eukprot:14674-Heterococcus_DN1.PRE.1
MQAVAAAANSMCAATGSTAATGATAAAATAAARAVSHSAYIASTKHWDEKLRQRAASLRVQQRSLLSSKTCYSGAARKGCSSSTYRSHFALKLHWCTRAS